MMDNSSIMQPPVDWNSFHITVPLNDSTFNITKNSNYNLLKQNDGYMENGSPQSIIYTILSMIAFSLCVPCLLFHIQHRNLAASYIISWCGWKNFVGFINALLWPTDDMSTWYLGSGWCDLTRALDAAGGIGLTTGLVCLFRGLANALDTDRARISQANAIQTRERIIEYLYCFAAPLCIMVLEFIVLKSRYEIVAIIGCLPVTDDSWVALMVFDVWGPLFLFVASYYASVVTVRVYRYKTQFQAILHSTSSNLSKNRFVRLYTLSMVLLGTVLPVQIYIFSSNIPQTFQSYSWSKTHSPDTWNYVNLSPAFGSVFVNGWIHIAEGFFVFFLLGFGAEASSFYYELLNLQGLSGLFARLSRTSISTIDVRRQSSSTSSSIFGDKFRFFNRKAKHESNLTDLTIAKKPQKSSTSNNANKLWPVKVETSFSNGSFATNELSSTTRLPDSRTQIIANLQAASVIPLRNNHAPQSTLHRSRKTDNNDSDIITPVSKPNSTHHESHSSSDDRKFNALEHMIGLDGASDDPDDLYHPTYDKNCIKDTETNPRDDDSSDGSSSISGDAPHGNFQSTHGTNTYHGQNNAVNTSHGTNNNSGSSTIHGAQSQSNGFPSRTDPNVYSTHSTRNSVGTAKRASALQMFAGRFLGNRKDKKPGHERSLEEQRSQWGADYAQMGRKRQSRQERVLKFEASLRNAF